MGDNGFAFGEHGLIDKRNAYEESIRIPMLAWAPGWIEPGSTVDGLVRTLDDMVVRDNVTLIGNEEPGPADGLVAGVTKDRHLARNGSHHAEAEPLVQPNGGAVRLGDGVELHSREAPRARPVDEDHRLPRVVEEVLGIFRHRDFEAVGAEAFLPPNKTR